MARRIPEAAEHELNRVVIRRGRLPEPGSATEVVVSEAFAETRGIAPGATILAVINGTRERLAVVGIGLSPEYVYATQGGAFPDDRNFGVLWMSRQRLGAAYRT